MHYLFGVQENDWFGALCVKTVRAAAVPWGHRAAVTPYSCVRTAPPPYI